MGGRTHGITDEYARETHQKFGGDPDEAAKKGLYRFAGTYMSAWKRLGLVINRRSREGVERRVWGSKTEPRDLSNVRSGHANLWPV